MRTLAPLVIGFAAFALRADAKDISDAKAPQRNTDKDRPGAKQSRASAGRTATVKSYEVALRDQAPYFEPKRLHVEAGSTVTWKNVGPGLTHTIYIANQAGTYRSGPIPPGATWSHAFAGDAVIKVSCEIHPYMYGVVVVGQPSEELIKSALTTVESSTNSAISTEVLEFDIPIKNSVPGILHVDDQDAVWVTLGGGGWGNITHPPLGKFARLTIDGDVRVFSTTASDSGPSGLVIGDGTVYITELMAGKIARFDTRSQTLHEFAIPTNPAWPTGLALDARRNLWFNETRGDKIGRLSPEGVITEVLVPTAGAHPTGMVIDRAGNVWFAERDTSKIGVLYQDGRFVEYALPTPAAKPSGLTSDRHGRVWFAEREGNKIGYIHKDEIREYPLPSPHSGPFFLAIDHNDNVWFSEVFGNRIGVLIPDTGRILEFNIPTRDSWPGGLAFDSQGNLWFTEQLGNKVGVMLNAPGALAAAMKQGSHASAGLHPAHSHH